MAPAPYRVRRVSRDTHDTVTIELEPPHDRVPSGSAAGPRFAPGQFNMLYMFGLGEVPISISGDPAEPDALVHTVRAVGAVTRALRGLRRGAVVGVRGPYGSAWPVDEAAGHDVVIMAGGIGLAPLRPAIYHLLARRDRYGKVVLLYGARTPADLLYTRQLERWRGRFDAQIEVTVDAAPPGTWLGHVGVAGTLLPRAEFDASRAVALVCGPEVMMRFAIADLRHRGLAPEQIYLSMERNMRCAIGLCGHCQFGPTFVCKDGPVFRYDRLAPFLGVREF
ncbi:MAG TPA: FAD/NAD(P)-binding protein [bacterium]|nr:FAD/NAD(P)-binding protein [bacterium]